MTHSTGRVVAIEGDRAQIEFPRSASCAHCGACELYGKEARVSLPNGIGAKPGDTVRVELAPGRVMGASALAYAFPLGGLLIGLIIGNALAADAGAAIGGLLGVALCALGLWRYDRRLRERQNPYEPRLVAVADAESAHTD